MRRAEGWLMLLVMGSGLFVVSPLLPAIAKDLGVSEGRAGWTVTAFAVGYLLGGPALGSLADRYGPRPVLVAALAGFVVANAATALATGAPAGALASSAIGWRGVFAAVAVLAAVALAVSPHRRVFAVRAAGVGRLGFAVRAAGLRRATPAGLPTGSRSGRAGRPGEVRARLRAVSLTGLWGFAVYGVHTYLGAGLVGSPYASAALVAVTLAGYGVGAVAGNLVGGVLADRFGAGRVTVASLGATAALAAVLGTLVHSVPVAPVLAAALFAVVAYPYFNAHQVRLLAGFPGATGAVLAWNNTALYGGILLGSAVGAQLLPLVGFPVLGWVLAAVALAGAGAAGRAVPAPATSPGAR